MKALRSRMRTVPGGGSVPAWWMYQPGVHLPLGVPAERLYHCPGGYTRHGKCLPHECTWCVVLHFPCEQNNTDFLSKILHCHKSFLADGNVLAFLFGKPWIYIPFEKSFSLRSLNLHAQLSEGYHDFVDINYTCNTNQYPQLGLLCKR